MLHNCHHLPYGMCQMCVDHSGEIVNHLRSRSIVHVEKADGKIVSRFFECSLLSGHIAPTLVHEHLAARTCRRRYPQGWESAHSFFKLFTGLTKMALIV